MAESIVLLLAYAVAALLYGGWRWLLSCITPLAAGPPPPSPPPSSHWRQRARLRRAMSTPSTNGGTPSQPTEGVYEKYNARTPPALTNADPRSWRSEKLPWKKERAPWSPTVVGVIVLVVCFRSPTRVMLNRLPYPLRPRRAHLSARETISKLSFERPSCALMRSSCSFISACRFASNFFHYLNEGRREV